MPNPTQWRNSGDIARFPFSENATLLSDGGVSLPDGLFADARIFCPFFIEPPFYLKSLIYDGSSVSGEIWGSELVGSFVANLTGFTARSVSLVDSGSAECGVLVFGAAPLDALSKIPIGTHTFSPEAASLETSCLILLPNGACYALMVADIRRTGKVALIEGEGIRLIPEGQTIRVDAVGATATLEECCQSTGAPLKALNGVGPDSTGRLALGIAGFTEPTTRQDLRQVLRITVDPHGLTFYLV